MMWRSFCPIETDERRRTHSVFRLKSAIVKGLVVLTVWMVCCAATIMSGQAQEEDRFALVIGNSSYPDMPLVNPKNDASDISATLTGLGFHVTTVIDADKRHMDMALANFARQIEGASGAALIYYAGHAMQYESSNFLFPTDAVLKDKFSVRYELVNVKDVKDAFAGCNCLKILVLDSCRSNPLATRILTDRGPSSRGLAPLGDKSEGMIVSYATKPGDVAEDGAGRNSPYAQAFLTELKQPQVPVLDLFLNVASDVKAATHNRQSPEISIPDLSRTERLYFLNPNEGDAHSFENLDFTNLEQLRQFVQKYPDSAKRPIVERQIATLVKLFSEDEERKRAEENHRLQDEAQKKEQEDREFKTLNFADLGQLKQFVEHYPNSGMRPIVDRMIASLAEEKARKDDAEKKRQDAVAERKSQSDREFSALDFLDLDQLQRFRDRYPDYEKRQVIDRTITALEKSRDEDRSRQEADRRLRQDMDRLEAERRVKQEAEQTRQKEEARRQQQEAADQAKAAEEVKAKAVEQARLDAERQKAAEQARIEEERANTAEQARLDAERQRAAQQAGAEAEVKARQEAKAKMEADAKAKAVEQAKAEADAKARQAAQAKIDADLKAKALEQAKAEAKARQDAEQARLAAEARARHEAEQAAADAKARDSIARQAAEQAKEEADAIARQAAAQAKAEANAKQEAEAKAKADAKSQQDAERQQADAKAKQEAEARAQHEAQQAKAEADAKAHQPADQANADAKAKADQQAKAMEQAKAAAQAKAEEQSKARQVAEQARRNAERQKVAEQSKRDVARKIAEQQARREEARRNAEDSRKAARVVETAPKRVRQTPTSTARHDNPAPRPAPVETATPVIDTRGTF